MHDERATDTGSAERRGLVALHDDSDDTLGFVDELDGDVLTVCGRTRVGDILPRFFVDEYTNVGRGV